jgi:uncharacterized protein YbaR (Trm112 family)
MPEAVEEESFEFRVQADEIHQGLEEEMTQIWGREPACRALDEMRRILVEQVSQTLRRNAFEILTVDFLQNSQGKIPLISWMPRTWKKAVLRTFEKENLPISEEVPLILEKEARPMLQEVCPMSGKEVRPILDEVPLILEKEARSMLQEVCPMLGKEVRPISQEQLLSMLRRALLRILQAGLPQHQLLYGPSNPIPAIQIQSLLTLIDAFLFLNDTFPICAMRLLPNPPNRARPTPVDSVFQILTDAFEWIFQLSKTELHATLQPQLLRIAENYSCRSSSPSLEKILHSSPRAPRQIPEHHLCSNWICVSLILRDSSSIFPEALAHRDLAILSLL